jgi:hypothetical protein
MYELEQVYEEFPNELRKKFIDAANYVLDNVVFKAWNEQEMKENWRKRSLDQILRSNEINHLFPCLDAAVAATKYLYENRDDARLKLLTEKGAVGAFRDGKSRALHIDVLVELLHQGINYGLNIGCGDVILYKQVPIDSEDPLEEKYLTTRPEKHERFWVRTPFLVIRGKTIVDNASTPILNFLETEHNEVKAPYGITKEEFHRAPEIENKKSLLVTNEDYDPNASSTDNREWLVENLKYLSGLREYKYLRQI